MKYAHTKEKNEEVNEIVKGEEKRISVYCELTFCCIDLSSFSHIDVYINKRLKRRHALLFHYLFHSNCTLSFPCHRCQSFFEINSYKFCASTKLNRFHLGLNTVGGRKSHQFCILSSESIYNFWLVILLVRFFLRVFLCICECLLVCLFVIVHIVDEDDDDLDSISIPIFAVGFTQKKIKPIQRGNETLTATTVATTKNEKKQREKAAVSDIFFSSSSFDLPGLLIFVFFRLSLSRASPHIPTKVKRNLQFSFPKLILIKAVM